MASAEQDGSEDKDIGFMESVHELYPILPGGDPVKKEQSKKHITKKPGKTKRGGKKQGRQR